MAPANAGRRGDSGLTDSLLTPDNHWPHQISPAADAGQAHGGAGAGEVDDGGAQLLSALLAVLDAAYAEMGVDLSEPEITAEELQALMLEEGVRPEDNILSSGIIAAREE